MHMSGMPTGHKKGEGVPTGRYYRLEMPTGIWNAHGIWAQVGAPTGHMHILIYLECSQGINIVKG